MLFVFTSQSGDSKGTQQPEGVVNSGTTANGHDWVQTTAGHLWVSQCDPKALLSVTVIRLKSSGLLLHKWARTQQSGFNQKRLQGSSLFASGCESAVALFLPGTSVVLQDVMTA